MNVVDAAVGPDSYAALPAAALQGALAPPADFFERVSCYLCGSSDSRAFVTAQDDLGGTPGDFHFVRCTRCDLAYQNPRISLEHIAAYYDDTYIAHRKKRNWGIVTPLFERAMNKLDAAKDRIVSRYVSLRDVSSPKGLAYG